MRCIEWLIKFKWPKTYYICNLVDFVNCKTTIRFSRTMLPTDSLDCTSTKFWQAMLVNIWRHRCLEYMLMLGTWLDHGPTNFPHQQLVDVIPTLFGYDHAIVTQNHQLSGQELLEISICFYILQHPTLKKKAWLSSDKILRDWRWLHCNQLRQHIKKTNILMRLQKIQNVTNNCQ